MARICFDLDGTICTQEKDYAQAKPIKERIDHVNNLYYGEHYVIINTARGSMTGNIDYWEHITRKQLKEWGVNYDELHVGKKIDADYFIDDKAINSETYFKQQDG